MLLSVLQRMLLTAAAHYNRRYAVKRDCLLPLAPPAYVSAAQFPVGQRVFAMYPETTSFYRGVIVAPCERRNGELCVIEFDDDEEEIQMVPKHKIPPAFVCFRPELVFGDN
jgi:SGF29 tudor-like domain